MVDKTKNPKVCKHGDVLSFPGARSRTIPSDGFSCKKGKWTGWAKLRDAEPICKDCGDFIPLIRPETKEAKVFCRCGGRMLSFRRFLTNKIIGYKCTRCGDLEMIT